MIAMSILVYPGIQSMFLEVPGFQGVIHDTGFVGIFVITSLDFLGGFRQCSLEILSYLISSMAPVWIKNRIAHFPC